MEIDKINNHDALNFDINKLKETNELKLKRQSIIKTFE